MTERIDVEFYAKRSAYGNCMCTCCHGTDYVTKIKIPETLYFNGKNLSTKFAEYWICDICSNKLVDALQRNIEAEKGDVDEKP